MNDTRERFKHCVGEPALILETQNGELDSFNQIVLSYQTTIFNTALYLLCDEDLAADATQEAFISAFRNIGKYHGGSFKAWLMRIVVNRCYDELRRQKRRPTTHLEPGNSEDEEMETAIWLADPGMSPEEKAEVGELGQHIRYCLDALPADFRAVVVLVDIQGMDYHDAASAMRTPVGTIKSRLARARMRMREHLSEFSDVLPANFQRKQHRQ